MIKEIFNLQRKEHISSGKFSISSVGSCFRKKYMEIKGLYREEYTTQSLRNMDLGNLFHRQAVKEILEKGELAGFHIVGAEINIPQHPFISGRIDQLLALDTTGELLVIDIKSCSDWILGKAKEGQVPQNYIDQLNLYLHFFKIKRGFIIFFGKHRGLIEEYEVKYDKTRAEKLISEIEVFIKEFVAKGICPEKCNKTISPFGCKVCGI